MTTWQILEKVIRRQDTERVAQLLHVSGDYVRRWRREPVSDEAPLASGQRSPLDRVCDLIDATFLTNPTATVFIVEHVNNHYDALLETHASEQLNNCKTRALTSANLLKEATEAINALTVEGVNQHTLHELIEMRDAADRAIKSVRATLQVNEEVK